MQNRREFFKAGFVNARRGDGDASVANFLCR